jgi:hypothetical protein
MSGKDTGGFLRKISRWRTFGRRRDVVATDLLGLENPEGLRIAGNPYQKLTGSTKKCPNLASKF